MDISSEMNNMEAELKENEKYMSRELLHVRVNEALKYSKNENFQLSK